MMVQMMQVMCRQHVVVVTLAAAAVVVVIATATIVALVAVAVAIVLLARTHIGLTVSALAPPFLSIWFNVALAKLNNPSRAGCGYGCGYGCGDGYDLGQRHCAQQCSDSKSVGIDTPQTSLAGGAGAGGGGGGAAAVGRHVKHSNCSLLHLTWHNSNRITCISLWREREERERDAN